MYISWGVGWWVRGVGESCDGVREVRSGGGVGV